METIDRLDKVEDKFAEQSRPDPMEDPDGYDRWILDRAKREIQKDQKPTEQPVQANMPPDERLAIQVSAAKDAYSDYNELVTNELEQEISADPVLRKEVWESPNPAIAAYKYAKKKADSIAQHRSLNLDKGHVEGGGEPPPPEPPKVELTDEEKHHADMFGIPHEKFAKQKQFINSRGY
jgi:hypothetical protein